MRPAADPVARLTFERGGETMVAAPDGSGARRLVDSFDGTLSPSGRHFAFVTEETFPRSLGVIDVESGARTSPALPAGTNPWDVRWFPDGETILFRSGAPGGLLRGVVAGNPSPTFTEVAIGEAGDCWNAVPGHDGSYLLCHDMEDLHEVVLDGSGTVRSRIPLAQIFAGADTALSSDLPMSLSRDGRFLAIAVAIDHPELHDGTGAIFVVDRETRASTRVTAPDLHASHPAWLPSGDALLFSAAPLTPATLRALAGDRPIVNGVYRVGRDGSGVAELVPRGARPSIAGP